MLPSLRHASVLVLTLVAAACQGSDGSAGNDKGNGDGGQTPSASDAEAPLTGGDQFLHEYATAVCRLYEPCCKDEGLGYDAGGCTTWYRKVTAALFPGEFVPGVGAACLSALEAVVAAEPDRCSAVPLFEEATLRHQCRSAFAAPTRSGKGLGEGCQLAGDCAATPETPVVCEGRCLAVHDGKDGEGPCFIQGNDLRTDVYRCHAEDGLYCHRGENVCRPHVAPGEYCPFPNACGPDVLCRGGTCEDLPGPGEPCANAIPGAGGFCRTGSACDVTTLTCGDALPTGAPCREPAQCATRVCTGGTCGDLEFKKRLNCTG